MTAQLLRVWGRRFYSPEDLKDFSLSAFFKSI